MGIKINKITINKLQGYYEPITFNFSKGLTLIKGNNSSGKTAVTRVLKAYQYKTKSQDALASLLAHGEDVGYSDVEVYHEETEQAYTLRHCVYRETPTRLSSYYEIYNSNYEIIHRTEEHDNIISSYIGFEVIEEPGGCFPLNFKGAKVNAFINTPLMTNGYILEGLCHIDDYEIRIDNIKEAIVKLNEVKREYNRDLKYYAGERAKRRYQSPVELENNIEKIQGRRHLLDDLYKKIQLVNTSLTLYNQIFQGDTIHSLLNLTTGLKSRIIIRSLLEQENLKNTLEILTKIVGVKVTTNRIFNLTNDNSLESFSEKTHTLLEKKSNVQMLKQGIKMQNLGENSSKFLVTSINLGDSFSKNTALKGEIIGNELSFFINRNISSIDSVINLDKVKRNLIKEEESQALEGVIQGYKNLIRNKGVIDTTTKYVNEIINKEELEATVSLIPVCPRCGRSSIL